MTRGDNFDDVEKDIRGFGSLAGEGIDRIFDVKTKCTQHGYTITVTCDRCGASNQILVEWPEVVLMAHEVTPTMWKVNQGRFVPHVGCGQCREEIKTGVTPDECQRWVNAGISAKYLSPQYVHQVAQQAQQSRAAHQPVGMVRRR